MDPIADLLTSIENGLRVNKTTVVVAKSKQRLAILEVLKKSQHIKGFRLIKDRSLIEINLVQGQHKWRRLSKLSRRLYVPARRLPRSFPSRTILISTPKGMMTTAQARKLNVGGELIAEIT